MTAYTDFHYSPTGSGVISGSQVLEQTEQGINGLGQYVQDNVSGAIDTANEALTTARSADSNATTAINLANSFNAQIIAANQTAGNALTTAQSAQNTANSASSLATTANNSAATALNAANSASAGVTTLTGTVNSLGNRMTAAENAINTNAGNITTLQNGLATTNANVTAAANAASSAQATATSAQATATSAKNAAYVLRYTGTTITGGGTIAYADIDNTDNIKAGDKIIDATGAVYEIASVDIANQTVTVGASPVINLFCDAENLIPAANDAYDLGSASYQWNNLYAKNYYYNGVAWGLDKANQWSSEQTCKSNNPKWINQNTNITIGVAPANNQTCAFYNYDKNGNEIGRLISRVQPDGKTITWISAANLYKNGAIDPTGLSVWSNLYCAVDANGYPHVSTDCALTPNVNNTYDLGTSTNKWKTLNGINPGALSIPSGVRQSILEYITNVNLSWDNQVTAVRDGYIIVTINDAAGNSIYLFNNTKQYSNGSYGNGTQGTGRLTCMLPVNEGDVIYIFIKAAALSDVFSADLYVMNGNVNALPSS